MLHLGKESVAPRDFGRAEKYFAGFRQGCFTTPTKPRGMKLMQPKTSYKHQKSTTFCGPPRKKHHETGLARLVADLAAEVFLQARPGLLQPGSQSGVKGRSARAASIIR